MFRVEDIPKDTSGAGKKVEKAEEKVEGHVKPEVKGKDGEKAFAFGNK